MVEQKPALLPFKQTILFEGNMVEAEIFPVREHSGIQEYAMVRAPFARDKHTRISLFKTKFIPQE